MKLVLAAMAFSVSAALLFTGCSSDARLKAQKDAYEERIAALESDLEGQRSNISDLKARLGEQERLVQQMKEESAVQSGQFDELAAKYEALLGEHGQVAPLPEELNQMLAAFAEANSELLSYDSTKGLVRLKSDVTFDLGSDTVKPDVEPALAALAQICSTDQAKDCQILVVGHTDDMPIARPETKAKHPTNWHLSVHRAIAVMEELKKGMPEERLAVMGFGEFKPVAPNQPNHRGNPLNRRVEIFIVPKESVVPAAGLN